MILYINIELVGMDRDKFTTWYHFLNVAHLLDDELEYELRIRNVDFSSGEPRHTKRIKLRYVLRKQREDNNFEDRELEESELEAELNQVDEKLATIRATLESRKARKSVMPQLQTRLVHLYFRLIRVKKHKDTEGLEAICGTLLREYFSLQSTKQSDVASSNDEDDGSDGEGTLGDEELEEEEEIPQEKRAKEKRSSNTLDPGEERRQARQSDELMEMLVEKMDRMITEKLEKLSLIKQSKALGDPEKIRKSKTVYKTEKRQIKKVKEVDQNESKKRNTGRSQGASKSTMDKSEEDSTAEEESEANYSEDYEENGTGFQKEEKFLRRRPRPVSDWKLRYDGKDEGRNLNKFLTEVQFLAKAEGISKRTLFNEAIHLFTGDARAWYIDGRKNRDFRNWDEMVAELKLEYQLPDMDYHYEQQASQRRQRKSEKFQDFYNAVKEIFDRMSEPLTEKKMFDILFRNLRIDYKNALLVKGVRSLRTLKVWGRKLDSANWFLYRHKDGEQPSRFSMVNEIRQGPQLDRKGWRELQAARNSEWRNRSNYKPKFRSKDNTKDLMQSKEYQPKPEAKKDPPKQDKQEGSSSSTLEKRIAAYKIPDRTVCFNCRGTYHHFNGCLKEREVFCWRCGFHDFETAKCPFCAKNEHRSS